MNKQSTLKLFLPIIIAISIVIGFLLGTGLPTSVSSSPIKALKGKNFNMLNEIINYVDNEYVDTVQRDVLIENTVQYLLQELDPHSYYIPAEELQAMNEPLDGNFEGIGIQFNIRKDTIVVVTPISGGPSEQVGIKAGDRIVKVDEEVVAGVDITNADVMKKLKGEKGTKVELEVYRRKSAPLNFTITRDQIPYYSVEVSYMIRPNTGFVKISRFARTTYEEFMEASSKLLKSGMDTLILDLRGNGGGYLNAAVNIADELLDVGDLIVYTEGRARPREEYFSTKAGSLKDLPLKVLIDEGSASASEILAGAIQDNDRGTIIGRRSFGKGLVQEQTMWPDGSATRLTIARYYTPTGRCIQRPYESGTKAYQEAIYDRYENGELYSADSITLPDSLKYTTAGGKVVYGGGGIMPDQFVPADTSGVSPYFNAVVYRGLIYEFAFNYVDQNRKSLNEKYSSAEDFHGAVKNTGIYDEFTAFAQSKGVDKEMQGAADSSNLIQLRLAAYIARNVWGSEGFYFFLNRDDLTVKQALPQ